MTEEYKKTYCCSAAQLGNICCPSCHDDAEDWTMYDLSLYEGFDGRNWEVCCTVRRKLDDEETYADISRRLDNLEKSE